MRWLIHLGGPSLILLGLADNSLIPMPGSTDVVTVLLAAHHRHLWIYYAIMATAGALLGGFLTYRMARKGGKETLERKFSKKKVNKIYKIFERWGFWAVAIPAILPPPFPIVPMLLAAGALQYPTRKFLAALAVGRGIRFTLRSVRVQTRTEIQWPQDPPSQTACSPRGSLSALGPLSLVVILPNTNCPPEPNEKLSS